MQTRRVQIPPLPSSPFLNPSFLYLSFCLPCCHARGKIYTNAGHKIRVFQCPPRECYLADTAEDQCLEFRLFLSFFHSYALPSLPLPSTPPLSWLATSSTCPPPPSTTTSRCFSVSLSPIFRCFLASLCRRCSSLFFSRGEGGSFFFSSFSFGSSFLSRPPCVRRQHAG